MAAKNRVGAAASASLVTVTFETLGRKTKMTFTEQVAILFGGKVAREQRLLGTEQGIDRLAEMIGSSSGAEH